MAQQNPAKWIPAIRNYESEDKQGIFTKKDSTNEHPLIPTAAAVVTNVVLKSLSSSNIIEDTKKAQTTPKPAPPIDPLGASDPLNSQAVNDPLSSNPLSSDPLSSDPLSAPAAPSKPAAASPSTPTSSTPSNETQDSTLDFIPWKTKKAAILEEFTTDELVGITVSFMEADVQGKAKTQADKTQQRLAELDNTPENAAKETLQLSQKEYEKHIENLHEDLIKAWNAEERVKALKIAIQCAKLLVDTSVIKFYPSQFVCVTEILDTFGRLVYERIAKRSIETGVNVDFLKKRPAPQEVSEQARETCRNWFYKIASIRELVPRIYVEMAILRCYEFIQQNTFHIVINRIGSMIKGIGDPLVAMYARTYLARKGIEVTPWLKDYLLNAFDDYIVTHKVVKSEKFVNSLKDRHITFPQYLNLFSPALDWVLQCLGLAAPVEIFHHVLGKYKECNNPVLLKHIISSFQSTMIASNARLITSHIQEAEEGVPKHVLYIALGNTLVNSAPPKEHVLGILNDVWKFVSKMENKLEYMQVADVYIEYVLKYCQQREVNVLLGDILRAVKDNQIYEQVQPQLHSVVQKVLTQYHNFAQIFGMENFVPLLDLFVGQTQVDVNKSILMAFAKNAEVTSDPIIINTMFIVGKTVHDSLNTLSFQDDIRQVSKAVSAFISKIDFGMDFEKHLNFYVDCRRAFSNLDSVKFNLTIGACGLAMRTHRIVKGKHTKKTSAFVRACIAFCFITIPSMDDALSRLRLFFLTGQVCLMNQALPQADAMFKSAIKLIQEVPAKIDLDSQGGRSTEPAMVELLSEFSSLLLVVPGDPEQGPFYLVKGLLKAISDYPWSKGTTAKIRIYLSILSLLSAYSQPKFPYHIQSVDSNDKLYSGDPDYAGELQAIINKILDDVLQEISTLTPESGENVGALQSKLTLDVFNHLVSFSQLNPKSATLAVNLWAVVKKNMDMKNPYLVQSLNYVKSKEGPLAAELYKKLMA
mmetsp:Transcript_29295/g.41243  ORF Transcript_29295/g.41243 Transcript_29295/m.41243 type:complete len:982 (+) Transcript_29295:64-3009(+)